MHPNHFVLSGFEKLICWINWIRFNIIIIKNKSMDKRIRASMNDERIQYQNLFVCLSNICLQTPTTDKIILRGLRVKSFNIFVIHFTNTQLRSENPTNVIRSHVFHFIKWHISVITGFRWFYGNEKLNVVLFPMCVPFKLIIFR